MESCARILCSMFFIMRSYNVTLVVILVKPFLIADKIPLQASKGGSKSSLPRALPGIFNNLCTLVLLLSLVDAIFSDEDHPLLHVVEKWVESYVDLITHVTDA